mmetsp:Transcript_13513/g.17612  ORF Transcript_13513/g.17612 Transcript_13513/m.17612 type:complete len:162 (-) Transcript_13513:673-1158(-)
MQAIVVSFQKLDEYCLSDTSMELQSNSSMAIRLSGYLKNFLHLVNDQCAWIKDDSRSQIMKKAALSARDVILSSWRRTKISLQGSIILMRDVDSFLTILNSFTILRQMPEVVEAWESMREYVQLFIVQPESLTSLLSDEDRNLHKLSTRFIEDCISRRTNA